METKAAYPAVTKVPTGIQGFDEITYGGLPRAGTTLVMGGAGSGKTVFALQSLVSAARERKEAGIFVAFEETQRQIVANAATFGWDIPTLTKKLFFLDAQLSPEVVKAGDFELTGMLKLLELKAREMDAKRIVFDGIDVLLVLLDDPVAERRELYRIHDWLLATGLTGIITQKVGQSHSDQRFDFLQFMVACVVILGHQMLEGSSFRSLRIMKYRGSPFVEDELPISLTRDGMHLSHRGPTELKYTVTDERVSSGVGRLDSMLRGGYHRGSNVLISGAPGTAKSTLSGLFAAAACARGERTLYVSFDEGADQIVRNLQSVGVSLAPHRKSGLLKMYSTRTRGSNIEEQFANLRAQVRAHRPRCMVIDPLSALTTKLIHPASADAAQNFLDFLKMEGTTVVNTSLMEGLSTDEATATGVSTTADTWIHVSYVAEEGERNRALTIVKSRGTGHSNQVRELVLSSDGVDLADVYAAEGKVLMGVARWEQEQKEVAETARVQVATRLKRTQLRLAQEEAFARLRVVQSELAAREAEIATLVDTEVSVSKVLTSDQSTLRKLRHADGSSPPPPASRATRKNGHAGAR
jgi:circadian clock protein KaiC